MDLFRRGEPETGGPLFRTIKQFFEDDDWHPQRVEGQEAVTMGFTGQNGSWRCMAIAFQEQDQVVFFCVLDTKVPLEKRRIAAEYLTRANYGLRIGNFEMDFEDGEVRCKTSVDVEGGTLTPQMVKSLSYCCCMLMDRYLPGLMKVAFGEVMPEAAIREIEAPTA